MTTPQRRHPFEMLADIVLDDWDRDALCAQTDPDRFFPEGRRNYIPTTLRKICNNCPVIRQCANRALEGEEVHGFWAGQYAGGAKHEQALAAWRAIADGAAA